MFTFFHPEKGAPFSPLKLIYLGRKPPQFARIRSPKSVLASNTRRILEAKKLRFLALAPTS